MIKLKPKTVRQTLEEIQHAEDIKEKLQVIAQPHRQGDGDDMTDAFGIFVRAHFTVTLKDGSKFVQRAIYDGGNEFFRMVYDWRIATGIPVPLRLAGEAKGASGPGIGETLDDWEKRKDLENRERLIKIKRCENAMKCSGLPGFRAAMDLVLDDKFPEEGIFGPV